MKEISAIQQAYIESRARADGIQAAKDAIWRRWMLAPHDESAVWQAAHAELSVQLSSARMESTRLMAIWMDETSEYVSRLVVDALPGAFPRRRLGARHG